MKSRENSKECVCEINGFRNVLLGKWFGRMGKRVGYHHAGPANIWTGRIGGRNDSRGINRNNHPAERTPIR